MNTCVIRIRLGKNRKFELYVLTFNEKIYNFVNTYTKWARVHVLRHLKFNLIYYELFSIYFSKELVIDKEKFNLKIKAVANIFK